MWLKTVCLYWSVSQWVGFCLQVSVLRQRSEGFVNLVQLTPQQQQQQQQLQQQQKPHMIIQLGKNQSGSAGSRSSSLVCVDYDSMDETPPVSPSKQEAAVSKEEDKPEEIRLATDAEGIELLAQVSP